MQKATGISLRLLFLLFLGVAGCPAKDAPNPSAPGGQGGTNPSMGSSVPPRAGEITPLPTSTFVFYRFANDHPDGKARLHLWAYDVVTRTERLISKVDDQIGGLGSKAGDRLAVSPDRKWIAFSAYFRPGPADDFLAGRTAMIWKVSADGSQYVRVSAPLTDWRPPCSASCDPILACEPGSSKCTPGGWSYQLEHPSWAPDGKTLFAHLTQTACKNSSCLPSVVFPLDPVASVISEVVSFSDRENAPSTTITQPKGPLQCNTAQPMLSPNGKHLAVSYDGCFASTSWGVIVSDPDGNNYQTISNLICTHLEWRNDNTGVYCSHGNKIDFIGLDKTLTSVFNLSTQYKIDHFSISPDGRWFVANLLQGGISKIFLTDLQKTPLSDPDKLGLDGILPPGTAWPSF